MLTGRMAGDENAEITFEYGLKSGAAGAGTTGNDIALAGDFNGVGFDQAVVARGLPGGQLLWLGDTDRDTTDEYQFLFGLNTDTPLIGDFNGDGYDDVAVIRENVGFLDWYVHYASPGLSPYPTDGSVLVAHASFTFGLAGDQPVAGDFGNDAGLSPERVADGVDDVAVARNNGGSYEWFFHYAESQGNPYPLDPGTGTGQSIDDQYIFGSSSAIAVVGDWDNDGDDNVGVVDDSGATPANPADWSLDTTDDGGTAEITLQYGVESDQFVVGRWADRYWDGEIGNDWSNEGNWSGNTLPATGEDVVIIQPGSISSINHDSGTTTIGSLTTADGGEVRVTGGSLIVDGEYNSDTTVLVAGGTLRLNDTLNALSLEQASGTLAIGVDNALGTTPLIVGGGSIEAVAAARSLDSNIELNGQLTVIGSQDLALSGILNGTGGLALNTSADLTLSGTNTYDGLTSVDLGTLILGHELALGSTAGETIVASGAALDTNGFSNSESIELNGDGVDGTGALRNTGTAASFLSGHVELFSDTTIAATVATIDLMGVVSGGGNLTKVGNDFLTLGNSGNDFTGDVTVVQGVLTSGRDGLGAVAGQTIINGGELRLQTGSYSKLELVVFNSGTLMADGAVTFPGLITLNADISVSVDTPLSLSGVIDGTGGLLKTGTDTLTLNGVNSYTGTTTVISGTLAGFGTLPGPVEVANGATLAPGNSPGRLNTGNLDLQGGAKLEVEIGGTNLTPTAQYDQVNVTGTVMLDGELNVAFTEGYAPNAGDTFTIINNNGTDLITTTFNGLAEGAEFLVDNVTFTISYQGGEGGNDVVLTAQYKTFVVTTTQDGIDNGSLRQAISDANASPGRDRIEFHLAEGSSGYVAGKWNILPVSNDLPDITEGVVIDGTTRTGLRGHAGHCARRIL